MNFVAIDFETANGFRGSPCEVSLVRVSEGKIQESFTSYIYQEQFDAFNVMLHGIKPKDVKKAPTFKELWPKLREFIGDLPLVAHYAAFDTGVIRDALGSFDFDQEIKYFCTVVMGRKIYDFPTYTLPWVANSLKIDFEESHRAEADATACAQIALRMISDSEVNSLDELADKFSIKPGSIHKQSWSGCRSKGITGGSQNGTLTAKMREQILSQIPESELYEDPDFVGKEIVFTGALESMTRTQAQIAVMKAGGLPGNSVTKKTQILVCGYQDARALKPGDTQSSKLKKAIELQQSGQQIEIIDEEMFAQMMQSPEAAQ